MRKIILTLFIFVLANTIYAQEWFAINASINEPYSTRLLSSDDESVVVELTFNGFFATDVVTPHGNALVISNDDMATLVKKGQPSLPSLSVPLIIKDNAKMEPYMLRGEYVDYQGIDIAPFKGDFPRTINSDDVPYTYDEVYQFDEFFPLSQIKLDSPYILRDFRAQNLKITPFAYNPQTKVLRVYKKMIIQVLNVGTDSHNVLKRESKNIKIDKEFKHIYEGRFINYRESMSKYEVVEEDGDMLIICYDDFIDEMQPFVEWKNTIGRRTTIVATSITGNTTESIKSYISAEYAANPNLLHILLVGDSYHIPGEYMPANQYTGCSDWWYGQLSGDDYYNELIVGRFCVEEASHVANHVEKVIHYERDINTSDTWLTNGQGVSRQENQGGHYGESDHEHIDNIREDLLSYNYNTVYRDYQNVAGVNSSLEIMSSHINQGVGIINYCNHGSVTSWRVFGFNNGNVNSLTNDNKLPYIVSVACYNGQYDYQRDVCFAEAWMRARNTATNFPTGALGGMFSYISQPWAPPMYGQDEINDIIVESYSDNIKRTMGGVSLNGNMKILDFGASNSAYYGTYNTWNLFGDPSLMLRSAAPVQMSVNHASVINVNSNTFSVNVAESDGGMVTLSKMGEIIGRSIINNGNATIQISEDLTIGELTLAVVAYNKLTYITTIDVIEDGTEPLQLDLTASSEILSRGHSTTLSAIVSGGSGNYSYSWTPIESLTNPTSSSTIAIPNTTTTYTCNVGDGAYSISGNITIEVVVAPQNLSATLDENNVILTWDAAPLADYYNVYHNEELLVENIASLVYVDADVTSGQHVYTLTAVYNGVESPDSESVTVSVSDLEVTTFANPGIIGEGSTTRISAYAIGANGPVTYIWTPAESLEDPNSAATTAFPTETTTYTVTATCGNLTGSATLTVDVVEIPENLTATLQDNNVLLEWEAVDHAEYYVVMRDGYVLYSYVPETSYIDDFLSDATYCYSVKAVHDIIYTPESEEVCVEVYGCVPPKDITAEYYWYDNDFGALVSWDRIETSYNLTEYRIYRSDDNEDYEMIGTLANVPGLNHYQYSDMNNKAGTYYYKVTAYYSSNSCESEYGTAANSSDDYVMINVTSIDDMLEENVIVYPNPVKDKLYIDTHLNIKEVCIYNMLGVKISTFNDQQSKFIIDISGYESGLYILNIFTESRMITRQISIIK